MPSRLIAYALLAASLFAAGALASAKYYRGKLDALRDEYATFKGGVEALGKAAQKRAAEQKAADLARKESADRENARTVAVLNSTIRRMRDDADRARGSFVPAAPASSVRADLACFDRASIESAIGAFVADVRGIADEGTAATVDLNTAKGWVR